MRICWLRTCAYWGRQYGSKAGTPHANQVLTQHWPLNCQLWLKSQTWTPTSICTSNSNQENRVSMHWCWSLLSQWLMACLNVWGREVNLRHSWCPCAGSSDCAGCRSPSASLSGTFLQKRAWKEQTESTEYAGSRASRNSTLQQVLRVHQGAAGKRQVPRMSKCQATGKSCQRRPAVKVHSQSGSQRTASHWLVWSPTNAKPPTNDS